MSSKNILTIHNLEKSFFDNQIPSKSFNKKYTDYSKYKINKPWGHEYLLYGNRLISIWVLCLNKKSQTSMHSHPSKITYLIPLKDTINLNTLDKKYIASNRSIFKINKGVYHQSFNMNNSSNLIMELEIPNFKNDIIRYHDEYGRDKNDFLQENKKNSKILNKKYLKKLDKKIKIGKKIFFFTKLTLKAKFLKNYDFFLILKGKIKINKKIKKPGYLSLVSELSDSEFNVTNYTYVVFF